MDIVYCDQVMHIPHFEFWVQNGRQMATCPYIQHTETILQPDLRLELMDLLY